MLPEMLLPSLSHSLNLPLLSSVLLSRLHSAFLCISKPKVTCCYQETRSVLIPTISWPHVTVLITPSFLRHRSLDLHNAMLFWYSSPPCSAFWPGFLMHLLYSLQESIYSHGLIKGNDKDTDNTTVVHLEISLISKPVYTVVHWPWPFKCLLGISNSKGPKT